MRLDKYISSAALMSRRDAGRAISSGRVTVSGAVVRDGSARVDESDVVTLDGKTLSYASHIYIILYKPAGFITATEDAKRGERVVNDLLPDELSRRVFPVGRLDRDTTGLLIMTDDGDAAHRALSPKRHVEKSYAFTCSPPLTDDAVSKLERGVDIGERDGKGNIIPTKPARVADGVITITEGKFHQIKRMFHAVGCEITSLHRINFAGIALDHTLSPGQWRYMRDDEISMFTCCKNGSV